MFNFWPPTLFPHFIHVFNIDCHRFGDSPFSVTHFMEGPKKGNELPKNLPLKTASKNYKIMRFKNLTNIPWDVPYIYGIHHILVKQKSIPPILPVPQTSYFTHKILRLLQNFLSTRLNDDEAPLDWLCVWILSKCSTKWRKKRS